MERAVQRKYTFREGKPILVRYADDFVIIHHTEEGVNKAKQVVEQWLEGIGLTLNLKKTRVVHTLKGTNPGFDWSSVHQTAIPGREKPLG